MSNKKSVLVSLFMFIIMPFIYPAINYQTIPVDKSLVEEVKIGGAYLTFAGKFGGELSPADVKKHQELGVAGCASGSKITKFTIIVQQNKKSVAISGDSHHLNKKILSLLGSLNKGDSFIFKNIKAKLPTGKLVDVVARKFTVV